MANAHEIGNHIKSVSDTRKITNAMYMISSIKLKKAKSDLDKTLPYFNALKGEVKRIFRTSGDIESRYFYPVNENEKPNGTFALLVITGDKGLAGAYNHNVIKATEKMIEEHADSKLYVVGEYGRRILSHKGYKIEKSFLYTAQNPTMHRARDISAILLNAYNAKQLDKIYVIYTDLKNSLSSEAIVTRLLPFHRSQFIKPNEKAITSPFEFTPSISYVLENIMPSYISGFIYSALIDSFCCEQSARMVAMSSANDNAQKIIERLSVEYNRMRQASITQEITEVASGARAQMQIASKVIRQNKYGGGSKGSF